MERHLDDQTLLKLAMEGDILAFQRLFDPIYKPLKAYLYRLLAHREQAEDITHDAFVKAFDKISFYKGESTFKTWVFKIATHIAYDQLKKQKRWTVDTKEKAKNLCLNTPSLLALVEDTARSSPEEAFDMKDHIDHCFTCMGKTLLVEKQVPLLLKDVFNFSVKEIAVITEMSEDSCKHLIADARTTMQDIFEERCSLINKNGVCHQCSELNGWFNPKQDQQIALNKLKLVKASKKYDREKLYFLRTQLIAKLNPLTGEGANLQDALMECDRVVNGLSNGIYTK